MIEPEGRVSDEEARELWDRATELQRAEERRTARGRAVEPIDPGDLSIEQVVKVAEEVGIARDHVLLALAERRLADGAELHRRPSSSWLSRLLLEDVDAVEVRRLIDAPAELVVETLQKALSRDEFRMSLEDRIGEDPGRDLVLVYRKPTSFLGSSAFHGALEVSDGRVLLAQTRAEGEGTRLRLRVPMYEKGLNLALSGGSGGLAGSGGAAGGVAAGEAVAGLLGVSSVAVLVAPAVVGAAVGAGLGVWAFRRPQRWGCGKGESALARLARVVAVEAEGRKRA